MKRRKRRGLRGMETLAEQVYAGKKFSLTSKAKKLKTVYCVYKGDKKVSCHTKKKAANTSLKRARGKVSSMCSRMMAKAVKIKKHSA